jgi:hypothetical protein
MSCDRYTDAIVDHACGAEISVDAAAHLKVCAACSRMFDEQRRLLQNLDRELQVALAIEPSARFVSEAMAGVERSAHRRRAIVWWSAPVAAAAVLVLLALGSLRFGAQRPADRHEPAAVQTASSAHVADPTPAVAAPSAPAQGAPRVTAARRRSGGPPKIGREPERRLDTDVLVPAGQLRAIERYMTLVRRGALDTSSLANADRTDVTAPTDLVIAPLSVELLVVPNGESGTGPTADRSELR